MHGQEERRRERDTGSEELEGGKRARHKIERTKGVKERRGARLKEWKRGERRVARWPGGEGAGSQARRSEKHETRISLSITYALNPGIYASGINARALWLARAGSSRLRGCGAPDRELDLSTRRCCARSVLGASMTPLHRRRSDVYRPLGFLEIFVASGISRRCYSPIQ